MLCRCDRYTSYTYNMLLGETKMNEFSLTKQIAKHGSQAIIVIPKILQDELCPKTLVEIKIKVLKKAEGVSK